ncbi:MAG: GNAT family N-acetyltransferase [Thermogutta sp.]|nr:GNAT family N-acetyltransferase [Thermogutta sp.]
MSLNGRSSSENASDALTVEVTKGERLGRAIELICTQFPEEHREDHFRFLSSHLRRAPPGTSGVLHVERQGRLVAAVMWTIYPGKIAILSVPGIESASDLPVVSTLCRAVVERLSATTTEMIFTSLTEKQSPFVEPLQASGFEYLTRLIYLAALSSDFPKEPPSTPYHFVLPHQVSQLRFTEIVEATYQGTLDCPQLNGMRQTSDVLASYRATSPYSPDLWFAVMHGDRAVGCLILADHAETNQMELVYMGLVPSERGQGRGADVVRHAQWLAQCRGRDALLLAVDTGNYPAIKTYQRLGFRQLEERVVYVCSLRRG